MAPCSWVSRHQPFSSKAHCDRFSPVKLHEETQAAVRLVILWPFQRPPHLGCPERYRVGSEPGHSQDSTSFVSPVWA